MPLMGKPRPDPPTEAFLADSATPPRARRPWPCASMAQQIFSRTHTRTGTQLLGQAICGLRGAFRIEARPKRLHTLCSVHCMQGIHRMPQPAKRMIATRVLRLCAASPATCRTSTSGMSLLLVRLQLQTTPLSVHFLGCCVVVSPCHVTARLLASTYDTSAKTRQPVWLHTRVRSLLYVQPTNCRRARGVACLLWSCRASFDLTSALRADCTG